MLDAKKTKQGAVQLYKNRWHCQNNITKKINSRYINRNQLPRQMKMWYKKLLRYPSWMRKADITTEKEKSNLQNPGSRFWISLSEITLRRGSSKLRVSRTGFEILGSSERLEVPQIQERKQKVVFARKIRCTLLGMNWNDIHKGKSGMLTNILV